MKTHLLFKIRKNKKEGKEMVKQQNKQNVQDAQQQAYTSDTNATSQSVIEEQISDTVAEGTIDVKLGKQSQEKA